MIIEPALSQALRTLKLSGMLETLEAGLLTFLDSDERVLDDQARWASMGWA